MIGWLWTFAALAAEPTPVVAIGDSLATPSAVGAPGSGGWVAVLADCLEERARGRYTIVDRAVAGQAPIAAKAGLATVLELGPGLVIVGVRTPAADVDVKPWQRDIHEIVLDVSKKGATTMLVGVIEPTPKWNVALVDAGKGVSGVVFVDLAKDWPAAETDRTALESGGNLTDQGHARVGAAVCDAVVAWKPTE